MTFDYQILFGAIVISFIHAIMPTHWASFAFIGKVQGWSIKKTMTVAVVSGFIHVLMTIVFGLAVVGFGRGLARIIGEAIQPIAGLILVVFGIVFLMVHFKHRHRTEGPLPKKAMHDRWAILSLIAFLAFSPCQALLPLFFAASSVGWQVILPMCFLIGMTTFITMIIMTYALLHGLQVAKFQILEDYEETLAGGIILLLGFLLLFHHFQH